jgi:hypothetical protein
MQLPAATAMFIHLRAVPAMISPACSAFLLLYDNCIARLAAVLTSTGAFFSAWCSAILQAHTTEDGTNSWRYS